jgi:hypothetical protein
MRTLSRSVSLAWLAIPVLALAAAWQVRAREPVAGLELDGQAFEGRIRATGLLGLFSRRGTLAFQDGVASWRVRGGDEQAFPPAPYTTTRVGDTLEFRAIMPGRAGDHVDWSGRYDGHQLQDVRAVWTRVSGDAIHDLFLPDLVTLRFTPD